MILGRQDAPPFKKALMNSTLISVLVGIVTLVQGASQMDSLLTLLFTFAVTLPALWLSFRFTQALLKSSEKE